MPRRKKPIKYYSPKRRAIYAQGAEIDALVLFELHNWTCFLCKSPIDRKRRVPDWQAATIEHITPISKHGTHTWDNVAPAHYVCNMSKADQESLPRLWTSTVTGGTLVPDTD
jgi:5-methylcytosine-specific restriction endonuclease McrA